MWQNNLKIAWRNLRKHASFSFINLLGLSLGLSCFLFIMMYVLDERSYDQHFAKAEQIIRIEEDGKFGANPYESCLSADPLADALKNDFAEVEHATRLATHWSMWVKYKELQELEKLLYVDGDFLPVFGIELLAGETATALSQPNSVVLSQNAASRYFGEDNPIGKTMDIGGGIVKVTGLMANLPKNTHFHSDFFMSLSSWKQLDQLSWSNSQFYTYALLREGASVGAFAEKLNQRKREYYEPIIKQYMSQDYAAFVESGNYVNLVVRPITDIHLYGQKEDEIAENGDIRYVWLFSIVGMLILLLACINFINLSTARAADRATEVGVRKVIGSGRMDLIWQFLSESTLFCLLAFLSAVLICQLGLPYFNELSKKSLSFSFLLQPTQVLLLTALFVLVSLLSGLYPAFFLSGFKPHRAIKSEQQPKGFHTSFRRVSVVFQFMITAVLLVSTIFVTKQLHYIQSKKLGYNPEQVFIMQSAWQARERYDEMKTAVASMPQVVSVSATTDLPGQEGGNRYTFSAGEGVNINTFPLNRWWVDHDFFNTLEMELLEGRGFDINFASDTSAVVLNETAARRFGLEAPYIGQTVHQGSDKSEAAFQVVGIVSDFHFRSLHKEIEPLGIFLTRNPNPANLTMRIRTSDLEGFINGAEKLFKKFIPDGVFTYSFFDERFEQMYAKENSTARLFNLFTLLAVGIACMGLFGLISYVVRQRTREIGIRKVLGASVSQIVLLLTKDYLRLVGLGLLLAIPL
ncbi:MAG: ABC transporter permease, partial [Bacteroidota bacterium]